MIELLIVIAIIGILAVAFIPTMLDAPAKARDAQRISNLKRIGEFIYTEYIATGKELPKNINKAGAPYNNKQTSWCVVPDSLIGDSIMNNLEFFSGVFPVDPSGDEHCLNAGFCCGHYTYIYPWLDSQYAAALIANVENDENGNVTKSGYRDYLYSNTPLFDSGENYLMGIQK